MADNNRRDDELKPQAQPTTLAPEQQKELSRRELLKRGYSTAIAALLVGAAAATAIGNTACGDYDDYYDDYYSNSSYYSDYYSNYYSNYYSDYYAYYSNYYAYAA